MALEHNFEFEKTSANVNKQSRSHSVKSI